MERGGTQKEKTMTIERAIVIILLVVLAFFIIRQLGVA